MPISSQIEQEGNASGNITMFITNEGSSDFLMMLDGSPERRCFLGSWKCYICNDYETFSLLDHLIFYSCN